jgi:small subunit ribosomal protein S17
MEENGVSRSSGSVIGTVIGNKMDKTIIVRFERKEKHPLYGKYIRKISKVYAHDGDNTCKVGDVVQVKKSRPLSKNKSWVLVKVVESADKS